MDIKVVFQNLYHGMHFAGEYNSKDHFFKYNPSAYIDYYREFSPDIMCLAEIPLDNEVGDGIFLKKLSKELDLPNYKTYVNEKSWIVEDKYYGTAILSKFPITKYESFNLPNPRLEIDHPDGTHWIMHDKGAQKATLLINETETDVYNLHYFPFHHFNRKINEPEFKESRLKLSNILVSDSSRAALIAGDFNNKGLEIEEAFPELFESTNLRRAITFDRADFEENFEGDNTQIDHILYTANKINLISSKVESNYSDHAGITATFSII